MPGEEEVTVLAPSVLESAGTVTGDEVTTVEPPFVMVELVSTTTEEEGLSPGELVVGEGAGDEDVVGGVELSPGELVGDGTGEDVGVEVGGVELPGGEELPGEED